MFLHAFDRSAVSALGSRNANEKILHQVFTVGSVYAQALHRLEAVVLNNHLVMCCLSVM